MTKRSSLVTTAAAAIGLALAVTPSIAFAQADGEAFMQLPGEEIPGVQAGWFVNATLDAMTDAVERGRPLILIMGDSTSNLTLAFARYSAPCPHFNQLAGAVTFAYGSPATDEFARRIASHFHLTDYPTISIIAPRTDVLTEIYRLEGFFDAATATADIRQVLVQQNYWPADRPQPAELPEHYLAYPNMACTPEGARRLGIGAQ